MTKPRILFVDDEPNILQGMRRMLHAMAREWDLEFALGGEPALELLAQRPFDAVVSDMRMPGMDGATLLARVKASWPSTVRIVLSGFSEREHVLRSMHEVHQYLRKPCDSEQLKGAIRRSLRLRALLNTPALRACVGGLSHLPTVPRLYREITAAMRDEQRSVYEIGDLVAMDVAFSTKVLQLVNSAFFGLPKSVTSPGQAAVLLGLDTLRALVLGTDIFSTVDERSRTGARLNQVALHSLRVATLARRCAVALGLEPEMVEEAFIAGFLHEVGKLVFLVNAPEKYEETLRLARVTGCGDWQIEEETFGASHSVVGAYLLAVWGLPDSIVEAIAYMHFPSRSGHPTLAPLTALHVADVAERAWGPAGDQETLEFDSAYLERLGVTASVAAWRTEIQTEAADGGSHDPDLVRRR